MNVKLGDLEFKEGDLFTCYGGSHDYYCEFETTTKLANRILREKLEKTTSVFWPDDKSCVPRFRDMGTAEKVGDTHTARLVCIEEI